jgi:hypothetical protein
MSVAGLSIEESLYMSRKMIWENEIAEAEKKDEELHDTLVH